MSEFYCGGFFLAALFSGRRLLTFRQNILCNATLFRFWTVKTVYC